jgi:hypothetical protein
MVATTASSLTVGAIVRVRHPLHVKSTCRAIVATLQDEKSACLIIEEISPRPLAQTRFLISPRSIPYKSQDGEDSEFTVAMDQIQELLAFETDNASPDENSINTWKERGDQLFRLGDAASAVPYYEMALNLSTHVDIGGTVILLTKGFPTLAEIDCAEDDSLDITIVKTGEESTIKKSDVVLGIQESDEEKLQDRILLNLARCMLQLTEVDGANRPKYFKAAVLACSLVLTIASYREDDGSKNFQTALYIRSKAQSGLSKWPHAIADAKKLGKLGNDQGPKLLATIEKQKKVQVKQDKNLAKAVSRWVQTATAESVSEDKEPASATPDGKTSPQSNDPQPRQALTFPNLPILLALLAAFLIHNFLDHK